MKWSKPRIIAEIRKRQRQKNGLRSMTRRDRRLLRAAGWHFGTWRAALQAAGVIPENKTRVDPPQR
jgi:hypothetical protein